MPSSGSSQRSGCRNLDSSLHFQCPICLEEMLDPRILMCGHMFCGSCLWKDEEYRAAAWIICPTCRKPHHNTADETTKVFAVANYVAERRAATLESNKRGMLPQVKVDLCPPDSPTGYDEATPLVPQAVDVPLDLTMPRSHMPSCPVCLLDALCLHATATDEEMNAASGSDE
jgi:hypothetical protein